MEISLIPRPAPIGTQYRQGDILLVAQAQLPANAEPILEPLDLAHQLFLSGDTGPAAHSIELARLRRISSIWWRSRVAGSDRRAGDPGPP